MDTQLTTHNDRLFAALTESGDLRQFVQSLVILAAEHFTSDGEPVLAAISLFRHKRHGTIAASSDLARGADEFQYKHGQGPCITTATTRTTTTVTDTRDEVRWPTYIGGLDTSAIRSIQCAPFHLPGQDQAALNLYSGLQRHFTPDTAPRLERFVEEHSTGLALAVKIASAVDVHRDLTAALESRTDINLAVGIIMGQNSCSQAEALAILQRASSTRNVKLRELATAIISSGTPRAAP
jgi:hypothetical protein